MQSPIELKEELDSILEISLEGDIGGLTVIEAPDTTTIIVTSNLTLLQGTSYRRIDQGHLHFTPLRVFVLPYLNLHDDLVEDPDGDAPSLRRRDDQRVVVWIVFRLEFDAGAASYLGHPVTTVDHLERPL